MKKLLALSLVLVFAAACGKKAAPAAKTPAPEPAAAPEAAPGGGGAEAPAEGSAPDGNKADPDEGGESK